MTDDQDKEVKKPGEKQPPTTDTGDELTDADVEKVSGACGSAYQTWCGQATDKQ